MFFCYFGQQNVVISQRHFEVIPNNAIVLQFCITDDFFQHKIFYVAVTDGICVISIHSIYHDFIITLFPTHKHAPGFAEENDPTQAELFAYNAISDERSGVTFSSARYGPSI